MIYQEELVLPAAELGECNPFPDIFNNTYIHAGYEMSEAITAEDAAYIGKGMIPTMLPYLTQDGYSRDRKTRGLPSVVLENEYLKAVFLPCLGGRLWSLYDKVAKRDLLYVNPVFQPCNLALRNAWFSGGVEFNVGIKGHNPLTCSPLFARIASDAEGNRVLSMYEFERIRGVVFSINAWLPDDSRVLYVKNTIENTSPCEKYMYWWTNMAIPSTDGTRVIVPTDESFVSLYNADHYLIDKMPIPHAFGTDVSYPVNLNRSMDYFYKIPDENPKWIAYADEAGRGMIHFSESRLKGRKLFLWGQGNGGKHWGEFLAGAEPHSGEGYLEIQAGLARTQLEHFPMPGNSTIEWTECFAPLSGNPGRLHGEWADAKAEVNGVLLGYTGSQTTEAYFRGSFPDLSTLSQKEKVFCGSDWGNLENRIRREKGLPPISRLFTDWETDAVGETDLAHMLLEKRVPEDIRDSAPKCYLTDLPEDGDFWETRMAELLRSHPENSTLRNQYGVTLYAKGKKAEAEQAWKKAAERQNPYALRNLAAYHNNETGQNALACEEIAAAMELLPESLVMAKEYGSVLCNSGDFARVRTFLSRMESFPPQIRENKRMILQKIRALLLLGRIGEAEAILTPDFEVADIKEGELSMSALWFEIKARKRMINEQISEERAFAEVKTHDPLPYALDFRMHE